MTTTPEKHSAADWARLGKEIADRRFRLDLSQEDLVKHGGPSHQTVRNVERGLVADYRPTTFRKFDRALSWDDGTTEKILNGTATRDEINAVVLRDMTPAVVVLNSSSTPVRLVSPDGRDYVSRSPTDINNLIHGHGYQLREPHPDWPNIPVATAALGQTVSGVGGIPSGEQVGTPTVGARAPGNVGDLTLAAWLVERLERRYDELKPSEKELHAAARAALSDLPSRPPQ